MPNFKFDEKTQKLTLTIATVELPIFTLMFFAIFFVFLARTIEIPITFPGLGETLGTIFALEFVGFARSVGHRATIQFI